MMSPHSSSSITRFAVVIPVYNGRAYLQQTLASVLSQVHAACEVIVVEDGSPVPSDDIVRLFPTVRYVTQKNTGVSGARNHGAHLSTAEWICFLDQDDVLLPGHLKQFAKEIAHNKNADLLYTPRVVLCQHQGNWVQEKITPAPPAEELKHLLLRRCPFPPSGIAVRRDVFEQSGGFCNRYNLAEDWEFWLRCVEQGRTFTACSGPTVCYRVHPESNSHRPLPILRANTLVVQERIRPLLAWPQSVVLPKQLISQQEADAAILLRQIQMRGAFRLMVQSIARFPVGNLRRYRIALHMLHRIIQQRTNLRVKARTGKKCLIA